MSIPNNNYESRADLGRFKNIANELSLENRAITDELITQYEMAERMIQMHTKMLGRTLLESQLYPNVVNEEREKLTKTLELNIAAETKTLTEKGNALRAVFKRLDALSKSVQPRTYSPTAFRQNLKNAWAVIREFVSVTGDKSLQREMDKISKIIPDDNYKAISQAQAKSIVNKLINLLVPKFLRTALHSIEDTAVRLKAASNGVEGYGEKEANEAKPYLR